MSGDDLIATVIPDRSAYELGGALGAVYFRAVVGLDLLPSEPLALGYVLPGLPLANVSFACREEAVT